MKICKTVLALTLLAGLVVLSAESTGEEAGETLLRAAIFVQNRAGKSFDDKVDVLNDFISTRLTEHGFSVIDKQYVLSKFREARDQEERRTVAVLKGEAASPSVEDALNGASALRLAQMIGADYLLVATITSIGSARNTFSGRGTTHRVPIEVTDYNMRVGLRVLEAAQGGSVYGDIVQTNERVPRTESLSVVSSDTINSLLDSAAERIATNIKGKTDRIRSAQVEAISYVPFSVAVRGPDFAVIELNGAVIGAASPEPVEFYAPPGIHMMRVSREWFSTWEKPVNIQRDQRLVIPLEFTQEGLARYQDSERFKRLMAEDAESYAIRQLADGERRRREESYSRVDTSKVERLSVGDHTPRVIVEKED